MNSTPFPPYVFCGDDFTGASDTLATLARGGLRCRLFLEAETVRRCPDLGALDAVGIATATRSMSPEGIVRELTPLGPLLAGRNRSVLHYKVCSTFDSSPETGSIGAAIAVLKQFREETGVVISGGQPSLGRYCLFSNLFARAADGRVYRIDRHPTMAQHPVTPMVEADLRELLKAQGVAAIEGIHRGQFSGVGKEMLHRNIEQLWQKEVAVLFDVEDCSDLQLIGKVLGRKEGRPLLAVGSSSIAEAYLQEQGCSAGTSARKPVKPAKPVFVLAGSRSPVTAVQIEQAENFQKIQIIPENIASDRQGMLKKLHEECTLCLEQGKNVLAIVREGMNHGLSRRDIACFTAELTTSVAYTGLIDRLGIAGGDTSSLALQDLGVESLSFEADIEPGLCLCRIHSPTRPVIDRLEVILKGGQMGSPGLFNRLAGPL